jgi:hypothetical protein
MRTRIGGIVEQPGHRRRRTPSCADVLLLFVPTLTLCRTSAMRPFLCEKIDSTMPKSA